MTTVEDRPTGSENTSEDHNRLKPRSHEVTDGIAKAPARAMLRAVGMGDDDWVKPQIGVASSWNEITPCNLSLDRLAKRAKEGVRAAAMSMPGSDLSHPASSTAPSRHSARMTVSTESAITSRETRE